VSLDLTNRLLQSRDESMESYDKLHDFTVIRRCERSHLLKILENHLDMEMGSDHIAQFTSCISVDANSDLLATARLAIYRNAVIFDRPLSPPRDFFASDNMAFQDGRLECAIGTGKTVSRPPSSRGRQGIGLMGGSFNPAHGGHRAISLFVRESLGLSEIWWMVSPGNPLKAMANDMASLTARLASAQRMSRRAPIKATAIEKTMKTRYTIDTLRAILRRYPRQKFIWLMGADNLRNFHHWRQWREIARQIPIAVVARPGYTDDAIASPAMAWFGRFVRPRDQSLHWTQWSTPALVILRFRPDPRSATAIRRTDPNWHERYADSIVRDDVTHMILPGQTVDERAEK